MQNYLNQFLSFKMCQQYNCHQKKISFASFLIIASIWQLLFIELISTKKFNNLIFVSGPKQILKTTKLFRILKEHLKRRNFNPSQYGILRQINLKSILKYKLKEYSNIALCVQIFFICLNLKQSKTQFRMPPEYI